MPKQLQQHQGYIWRTGEIDSSRVVVASYNFFFETQICAGGEYGKFSLCRIIQYFQWFSIHRKVHLVSCNDFLMQIPRFLFFFTSLVNLAKEIPVIFSPISKLNICDNFFFHKGGPLMMKDLEINFGPYYVAGIESFGPRECGTENIPRVYTKVSSYLEWIVDTMRPWDLWKVASEKITLIILMKTIFDVYWQIQMLTF